MAKRYIVISPTKENADALLSDMMSNVGSDSVPTRSIQSIEAPGELDTFTHYMLEEAEVENLKNDSRVQHIGLNPYDNEDIKLETTGQISFLADHSSSESEEMNNWAFARCSLGDSYVTNPNTDFTYEWNAAGEGVDIVITDSGIDPDHPEWLSPKSGAFGSEPVSRFQAIDWFAETGISGTQPSEFYQDRDGHGTHVTGTAAGARFGWAKEARIYSMKIRGLEGSGDTAQSPYTVTNFANVIATWHEQKAVDPVTGKRRPTIVNMSWGYTAGYTNSMKGNFRGTAWDDSSNPGTYREEYGMLGYALSSFSYRHATRESSVDVAVSNAVGRGVIFIGAAGNDYHPGFRSGELDYDNNYTGDYWNDVPQYYHRGSSPSAADSGVIVVGATEMNSPNGTLVDQKAEFSNHGTNVDIWAPGRQIMSATPEWRSLISTEYYKGVTNEFFSGNDTANRQEKLSGTSMASPNVCGMIAVLLGIRPDLTTKDLIIAFMQRHGLLNELDETQTRSSWNQAHTLGQTRHLNGAPNMMSNMPFAYSYVSSTPNAPTEKQKAIDVSASITGPVTVNISS